jgi:hypothetical protein
MVEYQPELLLLFEAFVRNVARTRESPGLSSVSSDSEDGCMRKWRRRSNDRGSSFGWSGLRLSVQVGGASASSGGPFPDSGVPWSTRFVSRTLGAFGSTSQPRRLVRGFKASLVDAPGHGSRPLPLCALSLISSSQPVCETCPPYPSPVERSVDSSGRRSSSLPSLSELDSAVSSSLHDAPASPDPGGHLTALLSLERRALLVGCTCASGHVHCARPQTHLIFDALHGMSAAVLTVVAHWRSS